jgi:hypothetical protein
MVTSRPLRTFPPSSVCWAAAAPGRNASTTATNTMLFISGLHFVACAYRMLRAAAI